MVHHARTHKNTNQAWWVVNLRYDVTLTNIIITSRDEGSKYYFIGLDKEWEEREPRKMHASADVSMKPHLTQILKRKMNSIVNNI